LIAKEDKTNHVADQFNEYFTKIVPQLAEEIPTVHNYFLKGMYRNTMFLLPVTPDQIRGTIHNLENYSF